MTRKIRLTESQLRGMIQEAVNAAMAQRRPMRKSNPNRLTENRLRNMIKESVYKALREGEDKYTYGQDFDEYNEFDRNNPLEYEPWYDARIKYLDGDRSKELLDTLINGIEEGDWDAQDAYYMAKQDGDWPEFVKKAENAMSWSKFDSNAVTADEERKNHIRNAYYNDNVLDGYKPFADAPDENGNRFELTSNALRLKGNEIKKKRKDGGHMALKAQDSDIVRDFNGTRRSIMDKL